MFRHDDFQNSNHKDKIGQRKIMKKEKLKKEYQSKLMLLVVGALIS